MLVTISTSSCKMSVALGEEGSKALAPAPGRGRRHAVIYSGLDWSGSPGRLGDPQIVFAIAHVDDRDLPALNGILDGVRQQLGLPTHFAFRHASTSVKTQRGFFAAFAGMPVRAHAYVMNTASWASQFSKPPSGNEQICHGMIEVALGCPDDVVAKQIMLIDLPASESGVIVTYRTALRRAFQGARRTGFKNVRPCPDHRLQGAIVQVADMIAGEINEQSGLTGPFHIALQSRVRLVSAT